jgi:DNA-binding response OmpR family regulator
MGGTIGKRVPQMSARILVAEPERDVRDLIVAGLSGEGYEVLAASSGVECLAIAQSERLDLICLEAVLPGIDGFKTVERLQEDVLAESVPIVFLTARTSLSDRVEGLKLGAHAYLTKPFAFPELFATVAGILERTRKDDAPVAKAGLTGSLEAIGIAGVVQAIEAESQSGVLSVTAATKWGRICFSNGRIVEAVTGAGSGDEAIFDMVSWHKGSYVFRAQSVKRRTALAESATSLLMRAFQRYDESRSAAQAEESAARTLGTR